MHRRGGPFFGLQQLTGMRQERLAVGGELDPACRSGEQPHPEVLLQRGHPFGHRLLGQGQIRGHLGELARFCHRHEGANGIKVHAERL